jgi:hypothetical protein
MRAGMDGGTAVYEVEASDAAQVLCRILGLFAQQDRPLASVIAHTAGDRVQAMLRLGGIDAQRASVIAHKLRALAMVESVEFTFSANGESSVPRRRFRRAEDPQHVTTGHLANVGR